MSQHDRFRAIAEENAAIFAAGAYTSLTGQHVDISAQLAASVAATKVVDAPPSGPGAMSPTVTVANEDSLAGAEHLLRKGCQKVAVLNFASARSPGGGYLRGGNAQEESLCRATSLYPALQAQPSFYAANKAWPDALYSDAMLYTPGVQVIRDGYAYLRDMPIQLAVITAAAPNRTAVQTANDRAALARVPQAIERRVRTLLSLAAANGHDGLVLGAWGCGVFGNQPDLVARRFAAALAEGWAAGVSLVHFAIPGADGNRPTFQAALVSAA